MFHLREIYFCEGECEGKRKHFSPSHTELELGVFSGLADRVPRYLTGAPLRYLPTYLELADSPYAHYLTADNCVLIYTEVGT